MSDFPSSPFAHVASGDRAQMWIDVLLKGHGPDHSALSVSKSLLDLADGLRHAIGLYNIGMLVIGGFLLFYHIAAMIAETAQDGVPFGQRTNKVWGPLRLVLAIILLIPVTGGLSSGQYLVVKFAEAGSTLASNGWQIISESLRSTIVKLAPPRAPNISALVTTATEIELCRQLYQSTFSSSQNINASDEMLHILNAPLTLTKIPAGSLSPEIWRYSNHVSTGFGLCGEYHFNGYRPHDLVLHKVSSDGLQLAAAELQSFAHEQTLLLISQADNAASHFAPVFLTPNAVNDIDIRADLGVMSKDFQNRVDEEIHRTGALAQQSAAAIIDQTAAEGWLAAASIIPRMMRLQEGYGELVRHALPEAVEPLLSHPVPARQEMLQALDGQFHNEASSAHLISWLSTYRQLGQTIASMRQWINSTQIPQGSYMLPSGLDLRDRLNSGTDATMAFGMYASSIDNAALAEGLWGSGNKDGGSLLLSSTTGFANPFTALAEFGLRQYRFGLYLLGMSGSGLMVAGATAPAILVGLAALTLLGGGLGLVFVVPFIPFVRFLIGALVWLLNVFEAVLAMPIVALAHLNPTGDGISGSAAKQAYRLWLALMIRPLFTLTGLVVGFVLLEVGLGLASASLTSFVDDGAVGNTGMMIIANLALVLMFDVFAYAITNAAFKGITWLPDQALRWISPFVATENRTIETISNAGVTYAPAVTTTNALALAAVTNTIAAPGGATVSVNATASASTKSGHDTQSHGLKVALFPSHSDKQATPPDGLISAPQSAAVHSPSTLTAQQLGEKNKHLKSHGKLKNSDQPSVPLDGPSKENTKDDLGKGEGKKDQMKPDPDAPIR
jgi:hypothetical protein